MKKIISSDKAPRAIGPYSQAVRCGDLVFISGQLPIKPDGGEIPADVRSQTETALMNLTAILQVEGLRLSNVVKTTVFMTDLSKFAEMNAVYENFFKTEPPARSTIEVKALPRGAAVEIEAIAHAG